MQEKVQKIISKFHSLSGPRKQDPEVKNLKKIIHPILTGFIAAGLFSVVLYVFAAPPATPYSPGETLNPSCGPGDPNCTVYSPIPYSGANSNVDLGPYSVTTTGTGTFGIFKAGTATFGVLTIGTYTFPLSDGSSGQVLTTGGTGTLSWSTPSAPGLFVGVTAAVATGSLSYGADTGYKAGDDICTNDPKPALSGSHMCSAAEILHTISTNLSSLATSGYAWVNNGAQGIANDCQGHSSSALDTDSGSIWSFTNTGDGGQAYLTPCDPATAPLACCK